MAAEVSARMVNKGIERLPRSVPFFLPIAILRAMADSDSCKSCEAKRLACEQRAHRWIDTLAWVDEEIGMTINFLDYHRSRSEKREYIEALRRRLVWLRHNMK